MRALVLGFGLALLGCRTQCMADEDATPEQMAKEKRAAARAQIVCKELQRPTIDATGERVKLSATREVDVGARAEIPQDAPRWDVLGARLERYKRHYKQVWPADAFEPFAYVELDPRMDGARAKTIVSTVAASGYTSLRIVSGDAKTDVEWARCGAAAKSEPAQTARDVASAFARACAR